MFWPRLSQGEVERRVREALDHNLAYGRSSIMGLPGSFLDREAFPPLPELEQHPWLRCLVENPNHIGCHTFAGSEHVFRGTQALERDLLRLCAEEVLRAAPGSYDGYVASGGTESNIQAIWAIRNYFRDEEGASPSHIGVLCSADTHYSIAKAADLTGLSVWTVPVDDRARSMRPEDVERVARRALASGVRWFIVVLNMGTTMFGSIDDPDAVLPVIEALGAPYRAHVDAAFGGFIYPFTTPDNRLNFADPRLTSFTMDGHKMLQAVYGTGIHLIRKGYIEHVLTKSATYVPGLDCTLVGSRSGASAVAVWMILASYGSDGGIEFCAELLRRTDRLCSRLAALGVHCYRHPRMNVVALRARDVPPAVADHFCLVPDTHGPAPEWRKIVVMDHVSDALIDHFLAELSAASAR